MINVERIPMKRIRMDKLALRRAAYAALAVLCVIAVYRAVNPPKQVVIVRPVAGAPDLPAQVFARDFAAAFLAYDAENPQRRVAALAPFDEDGNDTWDYTPPATGSRSVAETAIEQVYPQEENGANYVVAARTSSGLIHISVNVARTNGALQIVGLPAIVGGAARGGAAEASDAGFDAVKDAALQTVVERALKNWFSHQTTDLAADLSPSAEISLPDQTYELEQLVDLQDANDGSVRATVVAFSKNGERLTLTYDLNVEKRADRWTVSAIQTLPNWH